MYISKTRFINWTRCPLYFPLDLKFNPLHKDDIDAERERAEERMREMREEMGLDDEEGFELEVKDNPELDALLSYYNKVEDEALKVARRYFRGSFVADYKDVHKQKLFEYVSGEHTYRCYVDIYNETDEEVNIIEVKAISSRRFLDLEYSEGRGKPKHPLFVREGNVLHLNKEAGTISDAVKASYDKQAAKLTDRYSDEGKYPFDLAFQKYVIDHALEKAGDKRQVNYYLSVLNCEYIYDGARNEAGENIYNNVDGEELITFIHMNDIVDAYQPKVKENLALLNSYIRNLHSIDRKHPVGRYCEWGKRTECLFQTYCYKHLRDVPDYNKANNYINFRGFKQGGIADKYQLINEGYEKLGDVLPEWLENPNHIIQRECFDNNKEHIDKEKMQEWFKHIEYPIYHFDFESFPCPLPRFRGEKPYTQSCFEFSLHIERQPGVCDKEKDNFIFLNSTCTEDEREALVKAIVEHFEFDEAGNLKGTMLAQNTNFEQGRLKELAEIFPKYERFLLAISDKSADLIHLLRTKDELYKSWGFDKERSKTINYYHPDLSGSYSIKKTLPVLVPSLTYKGMDVGNGVEAYITYLNYDSPSGTGKMDTKDERRAALCRYCQQDTWAMVEILRAVRQMI